MYNMVLGQVLLFFHQKGGLHLEDLLSDERRAVSTQRPFYTYLHNCSFLGNSTYMRFQLAQELKICVPGFNPILFNFRLQGKTWVQKLVGISGRVGEDGVNGVKILQEILDDGWKTHGETSISIPKWAVIATTGKALIEPSLTSS